MSNTHLTCSDCDEMLTRESFADNPAISRGKDYICKTCTSTNRLIKRLRYKDDMVLEAELKQAELKAEVIGAILKSRK
tara:strand:- start:267 stop:500 length:234 start_codon:yes stop_codon:yes gene_type:complete